MIVYALYPLGETRVQREAEALLKNGYEVDVICPRNPGEPEEDSYKGVNIYREEWRVPSFLVRGSELKIKMLGYIRFLLSAAMRVTQLHRQKHYGSIQVHNIPDFLVFATLVQKLMGVPILLDLHDLMPEFFAGHWGKDSSITSKLIRLQERLSCRFANHVITVSEHWRNTLIRRGVPGEKCSVVMNVADDQLFSPEHKNGSYSSPHDGFRLIYHGSIHERYGLDLAIRAVDRVRKEIPEVKLLLVGDGPVVPELKTLTKELGVEEYVIFEPLHLAEELPEIIRACDVGLVPYRADVFTDGLLPTKLMEYAALGLPAIASRTTTIQSYFTDTNTHFFAPDDLDGLVESILCLYRNPEYRNVLARGSETFNRRYNWSIVGREYVELVNRLQKRSM